MCSRFEADMNAKKIEESFGIKVPDLDDDNGLEKRPTDLCLSLTLHGATRMNWGLRVDWSKQPLINARTETLFEKPTFRPLLTQRCVIAASAYFEWRKSEGQAFKNRISHPDGSLLGMAALYDGQRFTILTQKPSPQLAHVHSRMPVIMPAPQVQAWLHDDKQTHELLRDLHHGPVPAFNIQEETPKTEQLRLF